MIPIVSALKILARVSDQIYWLKKLQDEFNLTVQLAPEIKEGYWIVRQIYNIIKPIPLKIFKACGVNILYIKWLGENKKLYPNHGFYNPSDRTITLNSDIFYHPDQPDDFFDSKGYFVDRPTETLWHELFHSFDAMQGELSLKPEWLSLSGWSPSPKQGLKRMIIKEPGMPPKIGEWFYNPQAKFTRFYAKMNPWDDFADSGAFYLHGLDKLPPNKKNYFKNLFKKY